MYLQTSDDLFSIGNVTRKTIKSDSAWGLHDPSVDRARGRPETQGDRILAGV